MFDSGLLDRCPVCGRAGHTCGVSADGSTLPLNVIDIPRRQEEIVGLSKRVALEHIYAPFGSSDPDFLAYAPGNRIKDEDVEPLLDLGFELPELANETPDTIRAAIANRRERESGDPAVTYEDSPAIPEGGQQGKDVAEVAVSDAHAERYADDAQEGAAATEAAGATEETGDAEKAAEKAVDAPAETKKVSAPSETKAPAKPKATTTRKPTTRKPAGK